MIRRKFANVKKFERVIIITITRELWFPNAQPIIPYRPCIGGSIADVKGQL